MALLDVDNVLLDPDFTDKFNVIRRPANADNEGRLTTAGAIVFNSILGVVNIADPSDLNREDDYDIFSRAISVITQFRLRGQSEGFMPDIIVWRGNNYVVTNFSPFPQYGNGFYEVIAESMDKNDTALDLIINGQIAFNISTNSYTAGYL
jgi:hypothetical protein